MKCGKWRLGVLIALLFAIVMSMPAMAATQLGETEEAYWDNGRRWTTPKNMKFGSTKETSSG